ncbi:(2Fe-2S)-binding protein [Nocardia sp. KC 131]|uniref:(2Fe-2S)-binding protein n=1 Tax=Nocardia arseniciresistens TaxID=3392119 RepID=UPI00398ED6D5
MPDDDKTSEPAVVLDLMVNDVRFIRTVPARTTLADLVRDHLDLTGTHLGCEHGVCGACTVLIDGRSARSCLVLAASVSGHSITTVEGLADNETADNLRRTFSESHGLQCGFCTPGFMMSSVELLEDPDTEKPLTEQTVCEALSGNICRCTGYRGIVQAVIDAAASSAR